MKNTERICKIISLAAMFIVMYVSVVYGASDDTSELQYITGLDKFTKTLMSMSTYIAIGAFFAAGVAVMIGGELTGWVKQMVAVCVVVGTIASAASIFKKFFNLTGADIDCITTTVPIFLKLL